MSLDTMPDTGDAKKPLTGRAVALWFAGFFLVIFGANFVMSWFAVTTFSGIETEDAYRKGRDFNQAIEQALSAETLGWRVGLETQSSGSDTRLVLTVTGKNGAANDALQIEGLVKRPVVKGLDEPVTFLAIGNGQYAATVALPQSGRWKLEALLTDASGGTRKVVEDIWVAP